MGSTRVNLEPKAQMSSKLQTIRNLYISELPQKINNMRLAWQKVSEQKDISEVLE
jgi:hypothetical protein